MALAKQELGETLAAFEFLDQRVLDIVSMEKCIPLVKRRSGGDGDGDGDDDDDDDDQSNYQFCVLLVKTLGSNNDHDQEKMSSFSEKAMESGGVVDGILAQDLKQVSGALQTTSFLNLYILIVLTTITFTNSFIFHHAPSLSNCKGA